MKHPEDEYPTPVTNSADGEPESSDTPAELHETETVHTGAEWAAPQEPTGWEAPGSFSAPIVTPVSAPAQAEWPAAENPVTQELENEAAESDSPEILDTSNNREDSELPQDGSQQAPEGPDSQSEEAVQAAEDAEIDAHAHPDAPAADTDSVDDVTPETTAGSSAEESSTAESGTAESTAVESPAVESTAVESPAGESTAVESPVDASAAPESTEEEATEDAAAPEDAPDEPSADQAEAQSEAAAEVEHESTVAETLAAGHVPSAEPIAASVLDDTPLARELAEITRRRQALNAQSLPLPDAPRIFTVANQKGGVGKTTTTVNLAAALARGGARVLVIDLDPQGNASTALGVEHRADTVSVYDVIINDEPMSEVVQKSPEFAGLYCVPATIHLAGAEIELVSLVAREQRLRTALDLFLSEADEPFHYVFIDCPPSLGLLTINAFVAAREVLIPIQCEYYALEGLSQLLSNIQLIERHLNPRLTVSTILLTMYDGRTNLANQVADDVREHFPREVLDTLIPRSVRISEAPSYGQSVISYDPSSPGSLSYLEAAAEIAKRGAPA